MDTAMIVSSARNQSEMLRMLSGCILREQHQISRKNLTRMLIENIFFHGSFCIGQSGYWERADTFILAESALKMLK